MRTPNGGFPEYHTSADNLEFVRPEALDDSYRKCLSILDVLENNRAYINQNPKCEPRLGKRGLYGGLGSKAQVEGHELALLWVLNFSDVDHTLLDIAERSGLEFSIIRRAADALCQHNLLEARPN
jgi:aminopeptidase-like protein